VYLVGDADRERSLARLRRHYADGRLSVEELDRRAELLARAQTTRDLRLALRDLPYGQFESELVPRLLAFRASSAGEALVRRAVRVATAAMLLVLWLTASVVLLAVLGLSMLVAGVSSGVAAVFTLVWAAISWLSWRIWRGGARRA
jgi:predicted phage tail protein